VIDASWQEVYGQRIDSWRLPASDAKRKELAAQYGRDGYHLLEAVRSPGAPAWLQDLPAVQALRQIWIQQYTRDGQGRVIRREAGPDGPGLPPGRSRVISPYDTDARYSLKRGMGWDGYKIHLTETCAGPAGTVNLITSVATTAAPVPDVVMTEPVHGMLTAAGLAPGEHAADAGYISAELLLAARARGITLTGPLSPDTSPQARTGGYTTADFTIDWDHQQVTCPQGTLSARWNPARQHGTEVIVVKFPAAACRACPARGQCTSPARPGRQLSLRPRYIHEATAAARAEQATRQWKDRYAIRAGVEGTVRQATAVTGIRTARYRGLHKTTLEHAAAAAAINLTRLDAWWTSDPLNPAPARTTRLQRLNLTAAA
jgi:hypothetical protein